jgi:hypothetical protein
VGAGAFLQLVQSDLGRRPAGVYDRNVLEILEKNHVFIRFIDQDLSDMGNRPMPRKISGGIILFSARFCDVGRPVELGPPIL